MSEQLIKTIGTVEDIFGEPVDVSVTWMEDADLEVEDDHPRVVVDGHEFDQEGAETFARTFVSACWEAARLVEQQVAANAEGAQS